MAHRAEFNDAGLRDAVAQLRAGLAVAFATETVYGLGADTFSEPALHQVYELKGRPRDNPLIAHVSSVDQARSLTAHWPDAAESLARRFWPGPLTLVLPRSELVPDAATAGRPTIAARCPSHAGALRLLDEFGGPISAPSANRSSHLSPTTAEHVLADYEHVPDLLVLDGGPCEVGIESTVLDLTNVADSTDDDTTRGRPRLLRPGSVSLEEIESVIGPVDAPQIDTQEASPGTQRRHYAPRTPAILISRADLADHVRDASARLAVLCFGEAVQAGKHLVLVLPDDPQQAGRQLYNALRRLDAAGADRILIEAPPSDPAWRAVRDRLRRATAAQR